MRSLPCGIHTVFEDSYKKGSKHSERGGYFSGMHTLFPCGYAVKGRRMLLIIKSSVMSPQTCELKRKKRFCYVYLLSYILFDIPGILWTIPKETFVRPVS